MATTTNTPDPNQLSPRAMQAHMERVLFNTCNGAKDKVSSSQDDMDDFTDYQPTLFDVPSGNNRPDRLAQELIYQAWESPDPKERILLAKKALSTYNNCADAYVILAEDKAKDTEEARNYYGQGVEAGYLALGEKYFQDEAGSFWIRVETRPYMRAKAGLAMTLSILGWEEEAIEHLQDMLHLNPNDNQGMRYMLVTLLIGEDRDEEASLLINRYKADKTAPFAYSEALLAFRKHGSTTKSIHLLKRAFRSNAEVPKYLLGIIELPKELPDIMTASEDDEAVAYAMEAIFVWFDTEGAFAWLAGQFRALTKIRIPKEVADFDVPARFADRAKMTPLGWRGFCEMCGQMASIIDVAVDEKSHEEYLVCGPCIDKLGLHDEDTDEIQISGRDNFESRASYIFHVFQEEKLDEYLKSKGKKGFDTLEEANHALQCAVKAWNSMPTSRRVAFDDLSDEELKKAFKKIEVCYL